MRIEVVAPFSRFVSDIRKCGNERVVTDVGISLVAEICICAMGSSTAYSIPLLICSYSSHHGTGLSCLPAANQVSSFSILAMPVSMHQQRNMS